MPVKCCIFFFQSVMHMYLCGISFSKIECRSRKLTINSKSMTMFSGIIHHGITYIEIISYNLTFKTHKPILRIPFQIHIFLYLLFLFYRHQLHSAFRAFSGFITYHFGVHRTGIFLYCNTLL